MRRIVFLIVGLLISIVSLWYALQGFDLAAFWDAMGKMQIGFFLLVIVPYILTFMTKVWRWRTMFHPDEARFSAGILFSALMISYIPLPFRAGEVARAVIVSARTGAPAARVFSTIVVEKVLDVLALLLLLGISLPFVELPSNIRGPATLIAVVFLIVALVLLTLVLQPNLARKLAHLIARPLPATIGPRIEEAADHALEGLAPLANKQIALKLALWSLATWSVNSVTVYFLLLAFNLPLTPVAAIVLVVATNLVMAVPAAPGYVGTFELAVITVLQSLGVDKTSAQTFALVYHFVGLIPVASLGVIAAIQQGVGLAAFRRDSATAAPAEVGAGLDHVPGPAPNRTTPTTTATRDKP